MRCLLTEMWFVGAELVVLGDEIAPPVDSANDGPARVVARRKKRLVSVATDELPERQPCRLASAKMVDEMPWLVRRRSKVPVANYQLQQVGHAFRLFAESREPMVAAVFVCSCGNYTIARVGNVQSGTVKSCGCRKSSQDDLSTTVDGRRSPTYVARQSLLTKHRRGQIVEPRWLGERGFLPFLADVGERPDGTRLRKRIGKKGWVLGNVYWRPDVPGEVYCDADDVPMVRSGRLTQISPIRWQELGDRQIRYRVADVKCDCGRMFVAQINKLVGGQLTACPVCRCKSREVTR